MYHHQFHFQDLLDTFVKLATIAGPIITWILWRKIAKQLKVKESIYEKREIIYRELFKKVEDFF